MSRAPLPNNFDFVRVLAAGMVLCSHQFALNGRPEPNLFGLLNLGTLGVLVFFSVSGYLVAQSWDRDPHLLRFALKRFLRIWPGLAVVTVVAALLLGPAVTQDSLHEYFHSSMTWDYFSQLYLGIRFYLPGVFEHHPLPVVNGSLWTIPIEVRWYGLLMLAGVCGLVRRRVRWLMLAVLLLYAIYIYAVFDVQHNPRARFPLPDFGCEYGSFFCYGVLMHQFRDSWRRHRSLLTCLLGVSAATLAGWHHGYAALFVVLPFAVIWLGTSSTPVLRRFGRYGDFSYGIYIYAFMLQQLLVWLMGTEHSYAFGLLLSAVCTLACAALSWHLVERPALALKRHLTGAEGADAGRAGRPDQAAPAACATPADPQEPIPAPALEEAR